jgi:uncharacterized protein YndB with AHSA1/START domain
MAEIKHRIKIRASPEQVNAAIATAQGIRGWWTRDAALDPEVGGTGEFGFYQRRFVIKVKVEELRPLAHVGWAVISSGGGVFDGTTIAFDFRPENSDTVLSFAHGGFKEGDDNYPSATTRWGYYLFSLKRFLESGTGTPNPDDTDF